MKLYRRHTPKCKRGFTSRNEDRCTCPYWVDLRGEGGAREPLGVRDMARATKLAADKLRTIEQARDRAQALGEPEPPAEPQRIIRLTLEAAIEKYHQAFPEPERKPETIRKYRRVLADVMAFCAQRGVKQLHQVTPTDLIDYRIEQESTDTWKWLKAVEIIKAFFRFAVEAEWIRRSPAAILKRPEAPESEVVPFYASDIPKLISACDNIGKANYERRRALAMILVFRFTGMRISDVVTLSREDIQGSYIRKRAIKNNRLLRIETNPVLMSALDALPEPKGSIPGNRYFFWNGKQKLRSALKGADRTLQAVFRKAGVEGAHSHKFRHTLASELLAKGATTEEVGMTLGDDPRTVYRYYSKWIPERQIRQDKLLREIHGTFVAHTETEGVIS